MKAIQAIPNAPKMYMLQSMVSKKRFLHQTAIAADGEVSYDFKKGVDGAALFNEENANLLLQEIGEGIARLFAYVPNFDMPKGLHLRSKS